MAAFFRLHRTVDVAPFVADDDPNTTQPSEAEVFEPGEVNQRQAGGHALYFVCKTSGDVEVGTATLAFRTWVQNENDDSWAGLTAEEDVGHRSLYSAKATGELFVQLTALADVGGTVDHVEVWVVERAA